MFIITWLFDKLGFQPKEFIKPIVAKKATVVAKKTVKKATTRLKKN